MTRPDAETLELANQWSLGQLRFLTQTATATLWRVDNPGGVLKVFTKAGRRDEAGGSVWLNWAGGSGAVDLIRHNATAQFLSFASDGDATNLPDDQAIPVICDVMAKWPKTPPPDGLTPLEKRLAVLFARNHQSSPRIQLAREILTRLLDTAPPPVALHGDLHHGNVLCGPTGWVAIDPKGLVGDPCYDTANLFLNPIGRPDVVAQAGRIGQLRRMIATLRNLCPHRILCFAYVHAVVSGLWSIDDNLDPSFAFRMADLMAPIAQEAQNAIFP